MRKLLAIFVLVALVCLGVVFAPKVFGATVDICGVAVSFTCAGGGEEKCPAGYTGTPPNCTPPACPSGYTGTWPNCVPPPSATCPTPPYPTAVVAYLGGTQRIAPSPGTVVAVEFTPPPSVMNGSEVGTFTMVESSETGDQAEVQFTISKCPGDFRNTGAAGYCADHTQYTGGWLKFSIGPKPPGSPIWAAPCELPSGTTKVYFNIRQIYKPTPIPQEAPGEASCQFQTCPMLVKYY